MQDLKRDVMTIESKSAPFSRPPVLAANTLSPVCVRAGSQRAERGFRQGSASGFWRRRGGQRGHHQPDCAGDHRALPRVRATPQGDPQRARRGHRRRGLPRRARSILGREGGRVDGGRDEVGVGWVGREWGGVRWGGQAGRRTPLGPPWRSTKLNPSHAAGGVRVRVRVRVRAPRCPHPVQQAVRKNIEQRVAKQLQVRCMPLGLGSGLGLGLWLGLELALTLMLTLTSASLCPPRSTFSARLPTLAPPSSPASSGCRISPNPNPNPIPIPIPIPNPDQVRAGYHPAAQHAVHLPRRGPGG